MNPNSFEIVKPLLIQTQKNVNYKILVDGMQKTQLYHILLLTIKTGPISHLHFPNEKAFSGLVKMV